MRHFCLIPALSAAFLLAGCGPDTSNSAFNPATDVDLVFSTFDLTDSAGRPANLVHTRFDDFYRGIEPADSADTDALAVANALRDHIDVFIGAERSDDGVGYRKVRNPLDLINQVIASGEVANFHEGRRYISEQIDLGAAATYNTRTNDALIRFTDLAGGAALADRVWIYQALAWTYNPLGPNGEEGFEKVYRTIQYVARSAPDDETVEPPELVSLLAGSQYDALNFAILGYNQPEYATVDYLSRNYGSMELRQEYQGNKSDSLYLRNTDDIVIAGASPDCVLAELDYPNQQLRVFTSQGEVVNLESGEPNPAHCSHKSSGEETVIYATVAVAERQ